MNRIASIRHLRSDFIGCANAVRPVTDLASLDATLVMRSPRHILIVITKRAAVSSYTGRFGGLRLLFLPSAHAADFIFTRQAEGEERARGLRGTDENIVG